MIKFSAKEVARAKKAIIDKLETGRYDIHAKLNNDPAAISMGHLVLLDEIVDTLYAGKDSEDESIRRHCQKALELLRKRLQDAGMVIFPRA